MHLIHLHVSTCERQRGQNGAERILTDLQISSSTSIYFGKLEGVQSNEKVTSEVQMSRRGLIFTGSITLQILGDEPAGDGTSKFCPEPEQNS